MPPKLRLVESYVEKVEPKFWEGCELHLAKDEVSQLVADLYLQRLTQDMHAGDTDKPLLFEGMGEVALHDIMWGGVSLYVHGQPPELHYRWRERERTFEARLLGTEVAETGEVVLFSRIGDSAVYAERLMTGQPVLKDGLLERRMVVRVMLVTG